MKSDLKDEGNHVPAEDINKNVKVLKERDLSLENAKTLFDMAMAASENSYAPYSQFHVGAALMTSEGEFFTGVNVENASYGAAICAERSAVSAAVSAGKTEFRVLAVASPDGIAYPCGICRQVIFEFGEDIVIIVGKDGDSLEITNAASLLPKGFRI